MKFDMPCQVVQNLLEKYSQDLLDKELNNEIKKHLDNCSECRKEYEVMKNKQSVEWSDNQNEKALFKKAKTKINRKIVSVAVIVAVIVTSLTCLGMAKIVQRDVPYDRVNVKVEEIAFDDVDWLPAPEWDEENEYAATIKIDGNEYQVTKQDYDKAKKNGKIQYIHLTSKYNTDSFSSGTVKVNDSYVCTVSIYTDNKKSNKAGGPSWINYDKFIDKIVYCQHDKSMFESIRTGDDSIDTGKDAYYVIWESNESRDSAKPVVLYSDHEKFGKAKANAQIQYAKSYNDGELDCSFYITAEHENDVNTDTWGGVFYDLDKAVAGKISYDDLQYIVSNTNDERYYWEIVPDDCEYALIDGQKLYPKTADITLDGKQFTVKYIAGAVKNNDGKKGYSIYYATLYDSKGKAHTSKDVLQ